MDVLLRTVGVAAASAAVWLLIRLLDRWLMRRLLPHLHVRWGWIIVIGASAAVWPVLGWLVVQEAWAEDRPIYVIGMVVGWALFMVGVSVAGVWMLQLVLRTRYSEQEVCQPRRWGLRGVRCIRWEDVILLEIPKGGEGVRLSDGTDKITIYTSLLDEQFASEMLTANLPEGLPVRPTSF